MRTFLSTSNLYKAAGLAALITVMATGRIAAGGKNLSLYVPMAFLTMMFIAGAVTAWGRLAGMPGIVTDRAHFLQGALLATAASILALPVHLWWLDPLIRNTLLTTGNHTMLDMAYPSTIGGRLALVLWSAGFQTIFLVAAPMALFARLTDRRTLAVGLCLILRVYVTHQQIDAGGITDSVPLIYLVSLSATTITCILFGWFGMAPAMLFAAGLDLHIFFPPVVP